MLVPAAAHAGSLVLSGDYIKIGLNDKGTLGYNGGTSPGILYDGTGTGTFNPSYDYLTPGSPFEGFVLTGSNGSPFTKNNNNAGATNITGLLTDYSGVAYGGTTYDNRAVWTGDFAGALSITNDYFFNTDSQKIGIRTTITALSDLTGLAFSRQIDPDAQAAPGDSSATTNVRGADGVPETDLVYAEALVSKYVIGLDTNSAVTHNSAVTGWSSDTASYLAGTNVGDGDNTIGLGFDIGALLNGESIVLDYSYIFGTNISTAIGGPNNITGTRTVDELLAGDVNPVFDGGTLAFTAPLAVSLDLALEAGGGTIDTQGYDATLSGILSGAGALTKTGTGTLTLTGANSYTGGTTVSDGRLVGDTVSLQGDVVNNATVEFAQASDGAYVGTLSGSGALVKSGSGTLTLTGPNSYTGGTTVSDGRLVGDTVSLQGDIANNATVEFAQASDGAYVGTLSGSGALVKSGAGTLTLTGPNSYTGGTTVSDGRLVGDTTSLQGDVINNATVEFAQASDGAYGSALSGNGALVKSGAGTLTLTGPNSYTGGTTVSDGRLIGDTTSLQGDVVNNAIVEFAQANDGAYAGILSGSGTLVKSGAGTLILNGPSSYSGGTTVSDGRLVGNTTSLQGNIANNATVEFAQASNGAYAGTLSGSGALVKSGAGTLTLTGPSSYTGGTTVSDGRLVGNTTSLRGDVVNNATVEFAQASNGAYAGTLSGSGALVKSGAGTLTLAGPNSYAGGTDLRSGTLVAGDSLALGSGALTVGAARLGIGKSLSLANAVILTDPASTIDTAGFDLALNGNLSGPGTLTKAGAGMLTLSGTNSQNGIIVAGGILAFGSDAALGRAGSIVTIQEDTTLRTLADFTISHEIFVNDTQRAKFDSDGHDIVMAGNITGSGNIEKIGAGTLTLRGSNANVTINVLGGRVIAQSQDAIGGTGGDITLHDNGGFTAGSNMTVSQDLHVVGTNSAFDTGAYDVVLTGALDGNACLIKTGAGRLNLMAAGSNSIGACVEQGTLSFNNVFTGNVVVEQDGTAGGSGRILGNVAVSGVLAPGNSPGQLVVEGSVTQAAGSVLALDVDGTTAGTGAGHYDTLMLTGPGSVFTAGGTVRPALRGITGSATNSFTPQVGQLFQVVTAEGGVTGSFDGLTQPTDGLAPNTRFDVVYRDKAVLLAVTPGSYAAFAGSRNAVSAGHALDTVRGPAGVRNTSASGTLFDGLTGLDAGHLALTLEQLSGSIHADALDASTQTLRAMRGSVTRHLDTVAPAGTSLWSSVSRDTVRVKADGSGQGYSSENYNLLLGIDTHATPNLVVGAAISYGTSAIRTASLGKTDDAHYHGLLYAGWASSGAYLRGALSVGVDDYKVHREVALADGAHALDARPDGFSYGVDLEAGQRLDLGKAAITPFVGIAHDMVERESFAERGDAAVALRFGEDERNAWQLRGGATVSTGIATGNAILTPYARASVTRELAGAAARVNPSLNGAAMTVDAASFGKTGVEGGAGLEALFSQKVSLSVGYRYKDTGAARQHSVNAGLSLRW